MSLLKRSAVVAAAAGLLTLALAGPASAHVTVNPNTATAGGYAKVSFRVPNESDTASTVKLEVTLPADQPVASVSVKPVPGWTAVAVKSKLATPIKAHDTEITEAVSKITWTAAKGSEIKPGQFQEFDVSMGALPQSGQLVFKALQTYSDGNVVRWIDEPTTDGTEPEMPAPVLTIVPAATSSAAPSAGAVAPAAEAADEDSGSGNGLALAGLIAGLIALVLAGLAYAKAGRKPEATAPGKPAAS
ncbi:membrane protein [Actinoplanes ianthinogenes]|uniref:Membrane protein n=1 Tax=Actinoplanes ianthinogenes TaxID=122358 RepID=A0ABN6CN71_9ACTN|nr:YcnI family protein [Actinoplanes ianthinogenes]BCJ46615.1 membrane protein [Actinoplanes ianthinogenes]GGR16940.1 membrane protein [Actinoplanes ianthinogenes]